MVHFPGQFKSCNLHLSEIVQGSMLSPLPAAKWNYATALHLSNRAGFGATGGEIEKLIAMGPDRAVDHYVDFEKVPEDQGAPAWAHPDPERMEKLREMRRAGGEKKKELIKEYQREQRRHLIELRAWWLNKMASGSRPLQEKLVLFWHGHFATSVQKVKDAYLMWLQNDTFRRNAHGQWLSILEKVSKDPAMLIWLDQFQSKKEHPNENYAREVMELFALGEGHYTEKDVTEAARALTGWTCNRVTQKFIDDKRQHDTGVKSFLGQTGNLDGLDVLRQIVAQPQSGRFITRKLWNFFSSDNPTPRLAEALAAHFEKNGQHFKPFLQTLFRSEEFYAEEVRASQVKSPAQWLVGSVRMLDRELPPPLVCSALLGSLGQDLFAPPNVKGWDGGVAWITTNNLLNRYNQSALLVEGEKVVEMAAKGKNGGAGLRMLERELSRSARGVKIERLFSAEERRSRESFLGALEKRFLACPLKKEQKVTLREYLEGEGELTEQAMLHSIRLIMCTPQYQLT